MVPDLFSSFLLQKMTLPGKNCLLGLSAGYKKKWQGQVKPNQVAKNSHQANCLHQPGQANNPEDFETWFAACRWDIYYSVSIHLSPFERKSNGYFVGCIPTGVVSDNTWNTALRLAEYPLLWITHIQNQIRKKNTGMQIHTWLHVKIPINSY